MPIQTTETERQRQPTHPTLTAALLMIGVAFAIMLIAAAGVMT